MRGDINFILEVIKKFKDDIKNNVLKYKCFVEFIVNERIEFLIRKEMEFLCDVLKICEEY